MIVLLSVNDSTAVSYVELPPKKLRVRLVHAIFSRLEKMLRLLSLL